MGHALTCGFLHREPQPCNFPYRVVDSVRPLRVRVAACGPERSPLLARKASKNGTNVSFMLDEAAMSPSHPGLGCAAGLVLAALAADVALIRGGKPPISSAVRESPVACAIALGLAAHLVLRVPHDPLTALGGWVEGRYRNGYRLRAVHVQDVQRPTQGATGPLLLLAPEGA